MLMRGERKEDSERAEGTRVNRKPVYPVHVGHDKSVQAQVKFSSLTRAQKNRTPRVVVYTWSGSARLGGSKRKTFKDDVEYPRRCEKCALGARIDFLY